MTTKSPPTDLPTQSFASAAEFSAFLEREHQTAAGIYLKLAKKSTNIPSVTGAEAVEAALCYGWIDGRANSIDESWWTVRFTPRRAKSIWSQKNVNTVARLVEEGRMKPAGLEQVEKAKADGRWEKAYAGPATIMVPEDFAEALANDEAAREFFEGLNKGGRYSVLWRLATCSVKGRKKKIADFVGGLAEGKIPGAVTDAKWKTKKVVGVKKVDKKTTVVKKQSVLRKKVESASTMQEKEPTQPRREGLRRRTLV